MDNYNKMKYLACLFRMREKQQLAAQKKANGNNGDNNNAPSGAGAGATASAH